MKSIKWIYALVFAMAMFVSGTAVAQGNGHAYGHDKHEDRDDDRGRGHDRDERRDYYRDDHRHAADNWYVAHQKHLPPGLAKKRGVPPGLAKKMVRGYYIEPEYRTYIYPAPVELVRVLPPPPPHCQHVFVGGQLVLLNRNTNLVVDIMAFGH